MSDITPMPHDKYMRRIFKYRFAVKDVASRYRRSLALTDKFSTHTAKALYDNPDCPLTWPKLIIIDKGKEYIGKCKELLTNHDVKIQYAKSKRSMMINSITPFVTRLIGMTPAEAIKKKKVYAKPSCKYNRPIGYDEPRLSYRDNVRYLLEHGELEGGPRRRGTDMNWSPEIYNIGGGGTLINDGVELPPESVLHQ
ncbi:hypothetical protein RhiirA4_471105 [Rhizophagus irregularis]|uniref:Integrase catalytic domain-containing protein n=1 Tax=Rhizophagus irregularis TaxID=588596 RepID=A0A2I1H2H7_9GLOM|nr:hypothetical protein RhiirA4_471105 [Rhizophagus irregularis]